MGQRLTTYGTHTHDEDRTLLTRWNSYSSFTKNDSFPDLRLLPPEIGLKILSNVDARELRLCREFWEDLANDDLLWKRLCYSSWGYCTAYKTPNSIRDVHFWKRLFNSLETSTDIFNTDTADSSHSDFSFFHHMKVVDDDPEEIAKFITNTDLLKTSRVVALFRQRYDVLESYITRHNFRGWFLPIALRSFFFKLSVSTTRLSLFIVHILDKFSKHYCDCNRLFSKDSLLIVVHSLILLSNDLCNPRIRNKMSKREYIKNTLQAVTGMEHSQIDSEFLGHAYDNVYLIGHVAPERLDDM